MAVQDIVDRTPATRRLVALRRADHHHFVDDVEGSHETVRAVQLPAEAAWMTAAVRPIERDRAELVRGFLGHDPTLDAFSDR